MNKLKPKNQQTIFIGVSWPYASDNIHIGHLAGQNVACDVFARYHRLRGNKVLMVSGSDSHGTPVTFYAEELGIIPEELAEKSHKRIVETNAQLGLLYENYTSTTTENHKTVVHNVFNVLREQNYLTTKKSNQYYDPKAKRFLPDRYVRGTCPECSATTARGDECPECGEFLEPEQLLDPYSTLSDATPELRETEHFYLDLSKAEPKLKIWIKDKTYWRKWVREFTNGWLKLGLKPRPITRDMDYGIPVPVEGWDDKVIYVFFEAVIGYLSAAIEWAHNSGDPSAWEYFWKNPDAKHYYFIAGGNVPFHTIIWPSEIIAYNEKYGDDKLYEKYKLPGESNHKPLNLPYDVPANNLLMYGGKKMSKGDKTGISLETLLAEYDPDVIRYFFIKYAPENHNREFIWKDFIDANNKELVANIGNFVNRTLTFVNKRFDGVVPKGEVDKRVGEAIDLAFKRSAEHIEKSQFIKAIDSVLELGHFANKYFDDEKPWETVKSEISGDDVKAANTLYNCVQIINAFRLLLRPFLPFSSYRLAELIGTEPGYDPNIELAESDKITEYPDLWRFEEVQVGHKIGEPEILFQKLEYTEALEKADHPEPEIVIVEEALDASFSKVDPLVVVGRVVEVKKHLQDDNLFVTKIDAGNPDSLLTIVCADDTLEPDQIVPIALEGAKIKHLKTGKPNKISKVKFKGVDSEGVLCAAYEIGAGEDKERIFQLPKSLGDFVGTSLAKFKSATFNKDPQLDNIPTGYAVFSNIKIKKNRTNEFEKWVGEEIQEILKKHSGKDWRDASVFKDSRADQKTYGVDAPASAEEMIEFILENETVPTINTLVDLYNVFAAMTGLSIGAHDVEKLQGQARMVVLDKDIEFRHANTNEPDTARKGEFAYIDDKGILCRLHIKQGNRTSVTKDTKHAIVLFGGNSGGNGGGLDQKFVDAKMKEFTRLVRKFVENTTE